MTKRPGRRIITSIAAVTLTASAVLAGGEVAVAADGLPADAEGTDTTEVVEITEPDQQVPTGDAVLGEAELAADGAAAAAPRPR